MKRFFSISGRKNDFFDRMTFSGWMELGGTSLLGVRMPISVENAPTSTGDVSAGNGPSEAVGTVLESPECAESDLILIWSILYGSRGAVPPNVAY